MDISLKSPFLAPYSALSVGLNALYLHGCRYFSGISIGFIFTIVFVEHPQNAVSDSIVIIIALKAF